jgi:hypothetical protein
MWTALSDRRTALSITIVAGPRQPSHSRVRVLRDSWPSFIVSDSKFPKSGGTDPHIYIPQEQGGPVIPAGIRVPFRRLLRLAGLPWSYSKPPPHGRLTNFRVKSKPKFLYDWWFTAKQFVLAPSPLGLTTRVFFQLNPYSHSPYVTSLTRRWVCLLWISLAFRQVCVFHI